MHQLNNFFPDWRSRTIHESSPSHGAASAVLARDCPNYSSSQFLEGTKPGKYSNGVQCQDLERLRFAEGTFDIFITQDVLEHVLYPAAAFREIMRVLKPGGAHVFSVPKHKGIATSICRASRDKATGSVVHHLEPQYHVSPVGDGRALVTWDYGNDLETLIWLWSRQPTATYVVRDRSLGLDGDFPEIFITRKLVPGKPKLTAAGNFKCPVTVAADPSHCEANISPWSQISRLMQAWEPQ